MKSKSGMSAIITTVILVALSMVAVLIVWGVVSNIITSSEEDISAQANFMRLNMKVVSVEKNAGALEVLVKRNVGAGEFNSINFVVGYSDGDVEVINEPSALGELGAHRFSLNLAGDINSITSVSIAPVNVDEDGKSRTGNVLNKLDIEKVRSIPAPTDGLVLYMPFDSEGDIDGFTNNGATHTSDGKVSGAYSFDGASEMQKDFSSATGSQISASAWVKPAVQVGFDGETYNGIVSFGSRGTLSGFLISMHNDFYLTMATWVNDAYFPNLILNANEWNFVTIAIDGKAVTGCVNDMCETKQLARIPNVQPGVMSIGSTDAGARFFKGEIDELRVYNRTLSASEIQNIYESAN